MKPWGLATTEERGPDDINRIKIHKSTIYWKTLNYDDKYKAQKRREIHLERQRKFFNGMQYEVLYGLKYYKANIENSRIVDLFIPLIDDPELCYLCGEGRSGENNGRRDFVMNCAATRLLKVVRTTCRVNSDLNDSLNFKYEFERAHLRGWRELDRVLNALVKSFMTDNGDEDGEG